LVDKEEHDGKELIVYGGWRLCDPRSTVKEMADDGDSWGKTTTQPRRSATRKESRNGAAKQRLAGGECVVAASLGVVKSCRKRGKFRSPAPFIGGGERGGVGGPARRHRGASGLLV
jgi:hypothetical protein